MSWVLNYKQSAIEGIMMKQVPSYQLLQRPMTTSFGVANFKTFQKSPRSIKSSSSVVRSEKHKYFREMNKDTISNKYKKNMYQINHASDRTRIQTPQTFFTKTQSNFQTNSTKDHKNKHIYHEDYDPRDLDIFDTIQLEDQQIQNQQKMSRTLKRNMLQTQTLSHNNENQRPLISRQSVQSFSTHSLINSEFNNDLISSGKSIKQDQLTDLQLDKKNQIKRNNLSKFKIQSNRLFVPLTEKPQFKHVFRKSPAELLYKGDNERTQSLTKRMFSVYQKQDKEREKRAFEFKLKNSLVSKFAGTMQRPEEVQFCKDVLNHLTKVSKSTTIIPYSIALINPDNGLREQIQTNYNDKLESKEIEVAQNMVKQFKEKARQVGVFNKQIEAEITTIKKQRVGKYLKNAMDQLKSMNFAEDGSLDEDTVYWKDQFFYHVKQNNIQDVQKILRDSTNMINLLDRNKMTALHWAVKRNYISMAEMLLKNDSKKDSQDILGRTPIHLAAKLNYFEMTKLLLRYKTNLNIKNKKGLTPVEIAGSDDILNLISKAMRLGVIQRLSLNRPSRALKEAEQKLFRAAGEESD